MLRAKLFAFFALVMGPVFLPSVGPGTGTYGGGSNFVKSVSLDKQGRVTAVTTGAPGGGGTVTVDSPLAGDGSSGNHLRCPTCALTTTTISAGAGLSGGGDLSANRTLTLNLGNANTWTAAQTFNTAAAVFGAGVTATGSSSFDLSGSTGTFKTPTGASTFGGSLNTFANPVILGANSATESAGARMLNDVDPFLNRACVNIYNGTGSALRGLQAGIGVFYTAVGAWSGGNGSYAVLATPGTGIALNKDTNVQWSTTTDANAAADVALLRGGAAKLSIYVNSTLAERASFSQTAVNNDTSLILYSRDAGTWTAHRVVRDSTTGVLSMP